MLLAREFDELRICKQYLFVGAGIGKRSLFRNAIYDCSSTPAMTLNAK